MPTVNIHEAKTQFSRLVEAAARGETVIIAKAGKPVAKLVAIDAAPVTKKRRIGFMDGMFNVPDDFKTRDAEEIERLFYGE